MPEVNGLQLTQKLREHGYDNPVVGLTANPEKYAVDDQKAAGLNACIRKPIRKSHLYLLTMDPKTTIFDGEISPRDAFNSNKHVGIVDIDYTVSVMEDLELALETLDSFFNVLPENLLQLNEALNANDTETLKVMMHNFKGQTGYAGAPAIRQSAENFNESLTNTSDDKTLKVNFDKLISSIDDFIDNYPEFRQKYNNSRPNTP